MLDGTGRLGYLCRQDPSQEHAISDPRQSLKSGDVLGDRYRVVRHLTAGGFGQVYLAEHVATGQEVALKVLGDHARNHSPGALERFIREARITAGLTHPNTVRVFDVGEGGPSGSLFLAMEYLRGPNLEEVLVALGKREVAMSERQAIEVAVPVLNSLAEAHAAGLVHRDLKPSNIMLARVAGNVPVVKVLDFGCSLVQGSTLTADGSIFGTPGYMSPEQIKGEELDARSDLFSLGVMLHRCVTGRTPFEAEQPATLLYRYAHEQVPHPREIDASMSDAFGDALLRAMALRADARFADAREMRRHLEAIADQCHVAPRSLRSAGRGRRDTMQAGSPTDTGRLQQLVELVPAVPSLPTGLAELATLSQEVDAADPQTEAFSSVGARESGTPQPLDIEAIEPFELFPEGTPSPAPPTEIGPRIRVFEEDAHGVDPGGEAGVPAPSAGPVVEPAESPPAPSPAPAADGLIGPAPALDPDVGLPARTSLGPRRIAMVVGIVLTLAVAWGLSTLRGRTGPTRPGAGAAAARPAIGPDSAGAPQATGVPPRAAATGPGAHQEAADSASTSPDAGPAAGDAVTSSDGSGAQDARPLMATDVAPGQGDTAAPTPEQARPTHRPGPARRRVERSASPKAPARPRPQLQPELFDE